MVLDLSGVGDRDGLLDHVEGVAGSGLFVGRCRSVWLGVERWGSVAVFAFCWFSRSFVLRLLVFGWSAVVGGGCFGGLAICLPPTTDAKS